MKNFFISHNQADRQWAEWIAWTLEEAGYSTVLQAWDFRPGCNFPLEMDNAIKDAERTILILSQDFLTSDFTAPEWAAIFVQDPKGEKSKLLPIKVRDCRPEGLLASINRIDVIGLNEVEAKKVLLAGISLGRAKPIFRPDFPGMRSMRGQPQFPVEPPERRDLPSVSRFSQQIEIKTIPGDITGIQADVIALKFARTFYGADLMVARMLSDSPEQLNKLSPDLGDFSLVTTKGKISAKKALFLGVPALLSFRYGEIYNFSKDILKILKSEFPKAETVALTIHGVGYGLDETESVLSQIRGLLDSLKTGCFPPSLQCILIVERNKARAHRIQKILENNLSSYRKEDRIFIPINEFYNHSNRAKTIGLEKAGFESEKKPHIFVAMPFSEDMDDIYYYGIQPSVHSAGYLCERIDLTSFTGDVLDRIKSRIETSEFVIADLTGANPNVYLEVGYAWGKGLPTILLSKDAKELKFDVRGQRCINYKRILDLEKSLKRDLQGLLDEGH